MPNNDWFFPYPSDPLEKVSFIIGDLIAASIVLLIVIPIAMTFLR